MAHRAPGVLGQIDRTRWFGARSFEALEAERTLLPSPLGTHGIAADASSCAVKPIAPAGRDATEPAEP